MGCGAVGGAGAPNMNAEAMNVQSNEGAGNGQGAQFQSMANQFQQAMEAAQGTGMQDMGMQGMGMQDMGMQGMGMHGMEASDQANNANDAANSNNDPAASAQDMANRFDVSQEMANIDSRS